MKYVTVKCSDRLAVIELSYPPGNTLTSDLLAEMTAEVNKLAAIPEPPLAILLKSAIPKVFSLGVDPQFFLDQTLEGRAMVFDKLADLMEAIFNSGLPLITDINGRAMAGGAVLAVAGQFAAIDQTHGKISFSEHKVGAPIPRFFQNLTMRKLLPSWRDNVFLLGRNLSAPDAVASGLANIAYSSEAERDAWLKDLLGKIGRLQFDAVRQSLIDGYEDLRRESQNFRRNMDKFAHFLDDNHLGKGLREYMEGLKK